MEVENATLTTRVPPVGRNSLDARSPKGEHQPLQDATSQG